MAAYKQWGFKQLPHAHFHFSICWRGNVKWFIQYKIGERDCIINLTIHLMQLAKRHRSNVMCF